MSDEITVKSAALLRQIYNSLIPHSEAVRITDEALQAAHAAGAAAERARVVAVIEAKRDHAETFSHVVALAMTNLLDKVRQ